MYPLVFGAIMGRTVEALAVWIVERGGNLFLLEQLLGSSTLFGTFTTNVMLRACNFVALTLVALWCLSPLGGQAVLRVISIGNQNLVTISPLFYLDTSASAVKSVLATPNLTIFMSSFTAIFSASLISPTPVQQSPMDVWGNIKIPLLEKLEANTTSVDGWTPVPTNQNISYSSLLGSPIAGVPHFGQSTFQIVSSYFYLDCQNPVIVPFDQEFQWQDTVACSNSTASWELGGNRLVNNTAQGTCSIGSLMGNTQGWSNSSNLTDRSPRQLLFQSMAPNGIAATNCSVRFTTVESRISCLSGNCTVTDMRPCASAPPTTLTPLDDCETAKNFYDEFTKSCGPYRTTFTGSTFLSEEIPLASLAESYMMTDASPAAEGQPVEAQVNLSTLTASEMSERLTRVLNTYWTASVAPEYIAGAMPLFNFSNPSTLDDHPGALTNATTVIQAEAYVCNNVWLVMLFLSSGVLAVACVLSTWLKANVIAPDIFGHISSLTRDNPYVPVPAARTGSTLDGYKKAILLKDVKVKFGDVEPYNNVGHIALAALGGNVEIGRLKKGRLYL
jgi:hypothetical protein